MPKLAQALMDGDNQEIVHSGRLKFKAGLINKWNTVYCTLHEGSLQVFENPDSTVPLFTFARGDSWISAKSAEKSSLFILNSTESKSISSKVYLFDTESSNLLHAWLLAFKSVGWTSSVVGQKLRSQRRSVDNTSSRNRTAYRDSGFGGSLRGTRSISEPTFLNNGRNVDGNNSAYNNIVKRTGSKMRKDLSSLFAIIDVNSTGVLPDSVKGGIDSKSHPGQNEKVSFTIGGNQDDWVSNNNIANCNEKEIEVDRDETKNRRDEAGTQRRSHPPILVRTEEIKIDSDVNRTQTAIIQSNRNDMDNGVNGQLTLEAIFGNKNHRKRSFDLNHANGQCRLPRIGRFDHSKIFFDPNVSPDMKGKLLEAESRSRKTSLTRQGEHIRLSESDETSQLETALEEETKDSVSYEDTLSGLSDMIEMTNIDTGEKQMIRVRARKTSSVASEGDIEGESSVFHAGAKGSHLSYLESGYCSKESLSTNESADYRKSSTTIEDEINAETQSGTKAETNVNLETKLDEDEKIHKGGSFVHEAIKPAPSECAVIEGNKKRPSIADTGKALTDLGTMATQVAQRPSIMKRSSMTQLLLHVKDKFPGRKAKGTKKQGRKDQGMLNGSEMIFWHNGEKWKERWFMICDSCLLLFKDVACGSPDFAMDIRGCRLEVVQEDNEQGFLSFKLVEKNGKTQQFAAVTEATYQMLITEFSNLAQKPKQADFEISPTRDEPMRFDDAIIPYSESETLAKNSHVDGKQADKQESVDSGTDGDISCFEGSDASNVGIEQYASGWKDKVVRRRKKSLILQRPVVVLADVNDDSGDVNGSEKGPVVEMRRTHKPVAHSESSPPSSRSASLYGKSRDSKVMKQIEQLNVDRQERKMIKTRYSVPDFNKAEAASREELRRQQALSCFEELLKLKQAHENNQYPEKAEKSEKTGKSAKKRATSLYVKNSKLIVYDENGNHQQADGPVSPGSVDYQKFDLNSSHILHTKHAHPNRNSGLSDSLNMSDVSDCTDDIGEDSDFLRQTMLMKRRNSLRLQKQVISEKVKSLRGKVNQTAKDRESAEEEESLTKLEVKLNNIDKELQEINLRIDVPADDFKEGKRKRQQLLSKLRGTPKSTTPVSDRRSHHSKDSGTSNDGAVTSPPLRKRSYSHNFRLFGQSSKRDSEGVVSNSTSLSSVESFPDSQVMLNESIGSISDVSKSLEDRKLETQISRKTSSVSSVNESDEMDGKRSSDNRDALSKIEDFEQFAVEITAKRVTDCIDV